MCSPGRLAPEVFLGEAYTVAVDMYSFGILCVEVCKGGFDQLRGLWTRSSRGRTQVIKYPALSCCLSCDRLPMTLCNG